MINLINLINYFFSNGGIEARSYANFNGEHNIYIYEYRYDHIIIYSPLDGMRYQILRQTQIINAEHASIGFRTLPYKFQNQITQLGKAKPSITQQQWVLQEAMDFSIQILPGLPATKKPSYYFLKTMFTVQPN